MAQKITLTAYLVQRGVKAKALTKGEADLLGIPFPLQCGWPRKYGSIEIDEELFGQLSAHAESARLAAEKKARLGQVNASAPAPRGVQMSLVRTPMRSVASPVPGFVLRQARRYRGRKRAPWT